MKYEVLENNEQQLEQDLEKEKKYEILDYYFERMDKYYSEDKRKDNIVFNVLFEEEGSIEFDEEAIEVLEDISKSLVLSKGEKIDIEIIGFASTSEVKTTNGKKLKYENLKIADNRAKIVYEKLRELDKKENLNVRVKYWLVDEKGNLIERSERNKEKLEEIWKELINEMKLKDRIDGEYKIEMGELNRRVEIRMKLTNKSDVV